MKALVKTEPGYDHMEFKEVEEPEVYEDIVKIKTAFTGICGSDIHTFKGEYKNPTTPITLGHEFSGVVVEVGPDVKSIKVGDRVTSETTFQTCGECRYCKEKDYNLCSNRKGIGTQQNGSFTKYLISREESVHVLPENVSLEAGAFTEPLACCTHAALEKTNIEATDIVLVVGPGPIGLLLSQVVKSKGATVILSGVTRDASRLELAKNLGIDYTIDSLTENLDELVLKLTDGYGADKVFDCSGAVPAVNQALALTAKKGDFIQVGLFPDKYIKLDVESIIQREINYVGSRSQKPSSWPLALELISNGSVQVEKMVTMTEELENWRRAFEAVMEGNEVKVLLKS
ncbi:sorbitol dehydrogenase [Marinilactibacillus sp. 15R]|uniref:L-iditol 2-dehydrogenase n=2 Tax=Carnobacteriaceae TaxID=186828 RepID=A0A1I3YJ88_9LACT|nr:sorbitol dehydrogenase [Marinilactibacillus sp. 15R]SFK31246.1 L-iditol 2-dehydrogenase [Marinilactibacillus piezotolerans]